MAKNKGDLEQEILTLSQLHKINVQQLHDLDHLAVMWDTTDICSICQEKCNVVISEMEMIQKMGTPVQYGCFPLTNLEFKTWLHLKMLINAETPLINLSRLPPLTAMVRKSTCLCFQYNTLIQNVCAVCHLIEHCLLPHIDPVINDHEYMLVMLNIAHQLCKGHL